MDRQTRKDLKTDKFAEEVLDVFQWTNEHKALAIRYGSIAVAVLVIALGAYLYMDYQSGVRQKALADALHTAEATFGPDQAPPGGLHFASQEEKDKALVKAYTDLATKFASSGEGAIAAMTLASDAASKGNFADAEKQYKAVVDNAPKAFASLARLALAQVYDSQGKNADAQKLLQDAVNNPSETVSKEQASIALARNMASNNKAEALKMLDKLRTSQRVPVSGAAAQAYTEIDSTGKK
ncbi:MAG: tetratricopeptide repeat protein [Bryobacteraceae bacterium]